MSRRRGLAHRTGAGKPHGRGALLRDWLIAGLLLVLAGAYVWAAPHRSALAGGLGWWERWAMQAQTNWLPNQRGLNVAVLGQDGRLLEARSFDTYLGDPGFAPFVRSLPSNTWVVVVAQDEASAGLSAEDVAALQSLGGTDALRGRRHWAYMLVGRPGLDSGAGLERMDANMVDLRIQADQAVAGQPFPLAVRMRSAGFGGGAYAYLGSGTWSGAANFVRWMRAALSRA